MARAVRVMLDACVLYCLPACDLVLTLGELGAVRPHWTAEIEDEWLRNAVANSPERETGLRRRAAAMRQAFPDALVSGYAAPDPPPTLPDPDDVHVVAAALHAGVPVIVSFNVQDFPATALAQYHLRVEPPDTFLSAIAPRMLRRAGVNVRARLKNPRISVAEHLEILRRVGLVRTAGILARD